MLNQNHFWTRCIKMHQDACENALGAQMFPESIWIPKPQDDLYSERISLLAEERPEILSDDGDEGHWRILGGHQGLAEKMAQSLDLRLDSPVTAVSWSGKRVMVKLKSGQIISAKYAVITVPLACLEDIHFQPPLPEKKQMAIQQLGRGITTTVYFHFRQRFWPEKMAFLFHSLSSQVFWPGRNRTVSGFLGTPNLFLQVGLLCFLLVFTYSALYFKMVMISPWTWWIKNACDGNLQT